MAIGLRFRRVGPSHLAAFAVVGVLLAAWPSGAQAQINPFRGYKGPVLSKDDLAAGRAAADKLLGEDQAVVGKAEAWAGPTSGNHGTISVVKTYQRQGMGCRTLKSEVRYKKTGTPPRTMNVDVCQVKSGAWKLM